MIHSKAHTLGPITVPSYIGHQAMIPFNLQTLEGLPSEFKSLATKMLSSIKTIGTAYFTIHGKVLKAGETHRRPGPHTDGNYEPSMASWNHGGWKVGENGPPIGTQEHTEAYEVESGGIILASNYQACKGWLGDYSGIPGVGGDCSKITLDTPFYLEPNTIYYGNNHFIHESLPMQHDINRVLVRITLPQTHTYLEP